MSRQLPAYPNLEHLRNQAKDLLRELQQQNPSLKLADALHAVARDYGFSTWPNLKAHVEALPRPADRAPANPFVGEWTANVAKSQRHPLNQFQRATLRIAVAGDTVTISDSFVDESGRHEGTNTLQIDGTEHLSGNGYRVAARWLGSHVLEAVARMDGTVEGRVRYEVSADGKTLTLSADQQVIVFDRS